MTNPELDQLLKSVLAPERPPEFWAALPKRISAKLHWQSQQQTPLRSKPRGFDLLDWALGLGVLAVVCVVSLLLQSERKSLAGAEAMALVERCYRETQALFPNQVQAIVFDEAGPRIVLAEKADVPMSPPLYLKICGTHGCQEIVTFSGQTVELAGQKVEVLADSQGGVMLVGEHFYWSSQEGEAVERMQIKVKSINRVL